MTRFFILSAALLAATPALAGQPHCDLDDLGDAYIAAFNSHDAAVLEEALADDYVVSSPYGTFDRVGWIGLTQAAWAAFPDMQWQIEQVVAEDDYVTYRYSFEGTFTHDFLGFVAQGQHVVGSGLEINRYDEDTCQMVETWNYSDAFNLFAQLQ